MRDLLGLMVLLLVACGPTAAKTPGLDRDTGAVDVTDADADADADTDTDTDSDTDSDTDTDTDTDTDYTADCPELHITNTFLAFEDVPMGSTAVNFLTIINRCTGDGDLAISLAWADDPPDQFSADLFDGTLTPGEVVDIEVGFTPESYDDASISAAIVVNSSDPDKPTVTVALNGNVTIDADGDGRAAEGAGGPDCDDTDASIHPSAPETWYDGIDSDCDDGSDYDADGDGYDSSDYGGADCDDTTSDIGPGADEIWYDGIDGDCAGDDYEDDFDADGDGHMGGGFGDDCDDASADAYPGGSESASGVPDLIDNDCDGLVDEDYTAPGDVIITEVLANPAAMGDFDGEWFEVYNPKAFAVNIGGWTIVDGDENSTTIDDHLIVGAGEYAVVAVGAYELSAVEPDYVYSWYDVAFNNEGDSIHLDMGETRIVSISWEEDDAINGVALALHPDHLTSYITSDRAHWCYAGDRFGGGDYGTPGEATGTCVDTSPLVDNLVLFPSVSEWTDAQTDCVDRRGTLVWIDNETVNEQVLALCDTAPDAASVEACSIGLQSPFTAWENGDLVTYENWSPDFDGVETYTVMVNSRVESETDIAGQWNDTNASNKPYICRFEGGIGDRSGADGEVDVAEHEEVDSDTGVVDETED